MSATVVGTTSAARYTTSTATTASGGTLRSFEDYTALVSMLEVQRDGAPLLSDGCGARWLATALAEQASRDHYKFRMCLVPPLVPAPVALISMTQKLRQLAHRFKHLGRGDQ